MKISGLDSKHGFMLVGLFCVAPEWPLSSLGSLRPFRIYRLLHQSRIIFVSRPKSSCASSLTKLNNKDFLFNKQILILTYLFTSNNKVKI